MSKASLNVILLFDDPDCGGAAEATTSQIDRDVKMAVERMGNSTVPPTVSIKALSVSHGGSHRDALYRAMQDLFAVKHTSVMVVSLMKGHNPDEYRRIKELCLGSKPKLDHVILTHLSNYNDVGLAIRNVVRQILRKMFG